MEQSKETISGYADAAIAEAARHAASVKGRKLASWVTEAIEEKLQREGMIPSKLAETRSLTDEALAVAEIASPAEVLAALKRVRASAAKARALSC